MIRYNVPFIANPNDHCVPASIGMVLEYFEPRQKFTMTELDKLCGYQSGKGTWPFKHMLELDRRGYQLEWIGDFDLHRFANGPAAYLRELLRHDPDALEFQLTHSDMPAEATKAKEYLDKGLPFEHRRATFDDLRRLLDEGWLVRLEVNGMPLADKPGFDPHSVLAIGYDKSGAILHNPDGLYGSKPNQHVSWDLLDKAWDEYGGSYSLYGFKR